MTSVGSKTFVSSMSRDVLEDWLGVLFQENKANLESGSSANAEVIAGDLVWTLLKLVYLMHCLLQFIAKPVGYFISCISRKNSSVRF